MIIKYEEPFNDQRRMKNSKLFRFGILVYLKEFKFIYFSFYIESIGCVSIL